MGLRIAGASRDLALLPDDGPAHLGPPDARHSKVVNDLKPPLYLTITRLGPLKGSKDSSLASQIVKHARASKTSIYTVLHYAQNIANKVFTAYDWGDSNENRKRYGVPHPPSYQLSGIRTETALFWSSSDSLSSKEDMERLVKELPNVVACRKMALGHLDYLWGSQVTCDGHLYHQLVELLPRSDQSVQVADKEPLLDTRLPCERTYQRK